LEPKITYLFRLEIDQDRITTPIVFRISAHEMLTTSSIPPFCCRPSWSISRSMLVSSTEQPGDPPSSSSVTKWALACSWLASICETFGARCPQRLPNALPMSTGHSNPIEDCRYVPFVTPDQLLHSDVRPLCRARTVRCSGCPRSSVARPFTTRPRALSFSKLHHDRIRSQRMRRLVLGGGDCRRLAVGVIVHVATIGSSA